MQQYNFDALVNYLRIIPGINPGIGNGVYDNGLWWIKLSIDINHRLAWNVVQELAHVLNYISLDERLPTVFYPVSPPPYLNGGPRDYLSWIIESKSLEFSPEQLQTWLEGRLPSPVDKIEGWLVDNSTSEER